MNGLPELSEQQALELARQPLDSRLLQQASQCRDEGFGHVTTFSKKVFLPVTELCRDVCHYCTFAKAPSRLSAPFMTPDAVLAIARDGAALGCKEALFTLGEKPEHATVLPARPFLNSASTPQSTMSSILQGVSCGRPD